MKQPRVPEYRESEGMAAYIRSLILFLKDFTMAAWAADNQRKKEIDALAGKSGSGSGAGSGEYGFHIDGNGHLICTYESENPPPLHIDENGHLVYTYTMGEEA